MTIDAAFDGWPRLEPSAQHRLSDACDLICRAWIGASDDQADRFSVAGIEREVDPFVSRVRFGAGESEFVGQNGAALVLAIDGQLDFLDASMAKPLLLLGAATGNDADLINAG